MPLIRLLTTGRDFDLQASDGELVLDVLRRNNLPVLGMLLLDQNNVPVSLTATLGPDSEITALSMRNADFRIMSPEYQLQASPQFIAELFRPDGDPSRLVLRQYTRTEAFDEVMESVSECLNRYRHSSEDAFAPKVVQVALSPGGDGRILAEALDQYRKRQPDIKFFAVIVAVGFEDELEHLTEGVRLAQRFNFDYKAIGSADAATILNYPRSLDELAIEFKTRFPQDEPEVMLTYWVQQVNFAVARQLNHRAIAFGYNQEDVIADHLYCVLSNIVRPRLPIRTLGDLTVLAPLHRIPKRLLDAMDLNNSRRNYRLRSPSRSYARSALYLLSYLIVEKFPALADKLSGEQLDSVDVDRIESWLEDLQHGKRG